METGSLYKSRTMVEKYSFEERLNEEPDGTYITVGQMKFFLLRKNGRKHLRLGSPQFLEYYNTCRIYNLISDIMEEDEDAAMMYWDHEKDIVALGYPTEGRVSEALAHVRIDEMFMDDKNDGNDYDY